MTLHKSLHQKTKYYIPSCEKVLKVIDSGISQQKRSLNGEILRSHADMKLRWRNLQERMTRTEKEMQGVQELLSDLSAKATQNELQNASESALSSVASASASSRRSSTSTPSRSSISTARHKVGDWLSPSPSRRPGESKSSDTADSPTHSRSITPFRRIANRLHRSKTNESSSPPSIPLQGSSVSSSQTSGSPETQRTPLPKKTNAAALGHPTPTQSAPPMPRTVSSPPIVEKQQRRLSRLPTMGATFTPPQGPPQPSYVPSAMSERARSPLPPPRSSSSIGTVTSARPPWNVGTRNPQPADLGNSLPASTSTANRGRKSMPSAGTVRNSNARYSHITSTYSQNRPQSRIFTTPSASSFRPPSPTFSATSNTSASARRSRPSSPNSRIPAPGTSAERNGTRRPQGSPQHANEDVETLYFGATDEGAGTSLMQRALSPTPSQSAFSATSSQLGTPGGSRRKSRIPRLSLGDVPPPDPDMLGLPPPPRLPEMYSSNRSEIMTPEPALRSRAARVSAMYGRPSMSGRKSMGGVPGSMPPPSSSDFATPPHPSRSLTASTSGMRPSSRLSVGGSSAFGGFASSAASGRRSSFYAPSTSSRLATPLPGMPDGRQPYHANKHDPLDVEIGRIINEELLVPVYCQRETPHLSKMAAESQKPSDRNAFYWIGNGDKPVHCKLVERGDRKPRKVLCKIAGGELHGAVLCLQFITFLHHADVYCPYCLVAEYQDLYMYLSNQQVQFEPDM